MEFYFKERDYDLPDPQPGLVVGGESFEFSFIAASETYTQYTTPLKHVLRLYADIGHHALPEAISEFRLIRYREGVDVYPVKSLRRELDGSPKQKGGLDGLALQIEEKALLLNLLVADETGLGLLSSSDFRMILDLILLEDELFEREGSEANLLSLRIAIEEADNRRKLLMDRMRNGGRVMTTGASLDEVLRKVRAQQAGHV